MWLWHKRSAVTSKSEPPSRARRSALALPAVSVFLDDPDKDLSPRNARLLDHARTHASHPTLDSSSGRHRRPAPDSGACAGRTQDRQTGPRRGQTRLRVPPRRTSQPPGNRRRALQTALPPLPQGPRPHQGLLPQERHRRVQEVRNRAGRSGSGRRSQLCLPGLRPLPSADGRAPEADRGAGRGQARFHRRREPRHRLRRHGLPEERRRGTRALAQADQVRSADAAHRGEAGAGGRGEEEDPVALPERPQALETGGQFRSSGALSHLAGDQHRSAFELYVPDHARPVRDRHAPEPGRHRCAVAAGGRLYGDRGSRARGRGCQGRPTQAQGQDRRRRPGRRQVRGCRRHEAARCRQADSRTARDQGAG